MVDFDLSEGVLRKYMGKEKQVIIPNGVEEIADFAFYNCDTMETIQLPETLTTIGSFAFYGCDCLERVDVSKQVRMIGNGAFSCCAKLKNITLPEGLRTIAKSTFYKCPNLQNIALPSTITAIDHSAFSFCEALETLALPDGLTKLASHTFEGCLSLKQMILPDSIEEIGTKVFYQCPQLRQLTLSSKLQKVGASAFQTLGKLTLKSGEKFLLTPKMFDDHWNLSLNRPDPDNYLLVDSYLPMVCLSDWKPEIQRVLMANFLETYHLHPIASKERYQKAIQEQKLALLVYLLKEKRYSALNQALEVKLILPKEIMPYLDEVTDREEKAKLMAYSQYDSHHDLDDLEAALNDLF